MFLCFMATYNKVKTLKIFIDQGNQIRYGWGDDLEDKALVCGVELGSLRVRDPHKCWMGMSLPVTPALEGRDRVCPERAG